MTSVLFIFCGALLVLLGSTAAGGLLFRLLRLSLPWDEGLALWFFSGSALFSSLWFVLGIGGMVYLPVAWIVTSLLLLLAGVFRVWDALKPLKQPPSFKSLVAATALFLPFGCVYFLYALQPEASPDGSYYHNGFLNLYEHAHRVIPVPDSLYAGLSQGIEIQALPGFLAGRHCVPGVIQLLYLIALVVLIVATARRFRQTRAGIGAAFLVFAAPLVGYAATQALIDVGVGALVFGMFSTLQIWLQTKNHRFLLPAGLLAGFAVASKFSALPALAIFVFCIGWNWLRERQLPWAWVAVSILVAGTMIIPYLARNAIWYGNPLAPFQNQSFPNPNFSPWQEWEYRQPLRSYHWLGTEGQWWHIPAEVTLNGSHLQGLYGAAFVLIPFGLLGLGSPLSRRALLSAALLLLTYPENLGARFLMPAIPFLALFLTIAVSRWPGMLPLLLIMHGVSCWPPMVERWTENGTMRLGPIPLIEEVTRSIPEEQSLRRRLPTYEAARWFETHTSPGERILAYSSFSEAYTTRHACVVYSSTHCFKLSDVFLSGLWDRYKPSRVVTARFAAQSVSGIRILQSAKRTGRWDLRELHIYCGEVELLPSPAWKFTATSNESDLPYLLDRRIVTGWSPWEYLEPGQYVELRFPSAITLDRIVLLTTSAAIQPQMEFYSSTGFSPLGDHGRWNPIPAKTEELSAPLPEDLNRQVTTELYRRGVRYIFALRKDFFTDDLLRAQTGWGVSVSAEANEWVIFRLVDR